MNTVKLAVDTVLGNELCLLALAVIAVILMALWLDYIIRRWSWVPRNKARRNYAMYRHDAPVPVDLRAYDAENPVNGGCGRERVTVEVGGETFTLYRM